MTASIRMTIWLGGMAWILAGMLSCGEPKTYDELMRHPKKLHKAYQQCYREQERQAYCRIVAQAYKDMAVLERKLRLNPTHFGLEIIALQNKMVRQKNYNRYQDMQATLAYYYAILRLHSPV